MFAIAYRMTGSVSEAEDITQDALVRMLREDTVVANPDAFATTVATRLAIDHLRSARVRRESYVGEWLPEPRVAEPDPAVDPAAALDRDETLSIAFLYVLERLSPTERAAFVLREAFDYPYERIAEVIGRTPDNCRQLVTRARARLGEDRPRFEASVERRDALAGRFFAACREGDLDGLEKLLADDVTFRGDGGGKIAALAHPATGATRVARFILGLVRQTAAQGIALEPVLVNGEPGAVARAADGTVAAVLCLHIVDDRIAAVFNVLNPDKLGHVA
jgi:RNA polymerase sigma-70 factor (ECF subfamily)